VTINNTIHDYFIKNGFVKVSSGRDLPKELTIQFRRYNYLYRGTLPVEDNKYKVDIILGFQSIPFHTWPKCFLAEPAKVAKHSQAHVEPNGAYCYVDSESNNLDISRPLESLIFTIETLRISLEKSFSGINQNDIATELPLYLQNDYITEFYDNNAKEFECIEYNENSALRYVIRPKKLDSNIATLLWEPIKYVPKKKLSFIKVNLDSPPQLNEDLPITSLRLLVRWLEKNQARSLAQLTANIHKAVNNKKKNDKIAILFQYEVNDDTINFAVILSLSSVGVNLFKGAAPRRLRKIMATWNDNLCTFSFNTSRVINVNPVNGVIRNIPNRNFLDLRIALIGAGTLGGYVSEQLVNLGAGLKLNENKVVLDIFDSGTLEPDNLSRHALGYTALWQNKALALAQKLKKDNPLLQSSLRGIDKNISFDNIDHLKNYDLIINATGDQHSTDTLNYYWYITPIDRPIVHGWIEGSGLGCRIIRLHNKSSCSRCLRELNNTPRYRVFKNNDDVPIIKKSCGSSYIPYPPTVSIRSASLIVEAALDAIHLNDDNYIYFDSMSDKLVVHKDKKLTKHNQCPICC
jgi:molybdopterin/thiamine biosynthesis adenylyltransferase